MKTADDADFEHTDRQRRRHCTGPQHPGGPDAYRYVPARCVRVPRTSKPSPSRSSTRASSTKSLVKILEDESTALQALRDSLVRSSNGNGNGSEEAFISSVSKAEGEALRAANAAAILPLTMAFMKHVQRAKKTMSHSRSIKFASKIVDTVDAALTNNSSKKNMISREDKLGKKLIWKLALDLQDYIRSLIALLADSK
jgi:hypothetical protein